MSESALPPEERARVTQFDPVDLDRTVIALPLLREMQEEVARIGQLAVLSPSALSEFNAAVEYPVGHPGGTRAARAGEETGPGGDGRHAELVAAIDEQTVEPPLKGLPYSLARLHASVIRRLQSASDRLANGPIVRVHPKRFEVIIDLNLTYRGGRGAARQWVLDNIG